MKVMLLEDDHETARLVERGLVLEGHEVAVVHDVPSAMERLATQVFDAAVLDLMVPGGTGFDVLERLREDCPEAAVLILSARDAVRDRVQGLDRGADDYLVKPFVLAELAARLRAVTRRPGERSAVLRHGVLTLDLLKRQCRVGENVLKLTRIEFDLLARLVRERGAVVPRSVLLRDVWRIGFEPGTNVVEVLIHRLRRKLADATAPDLLRTVRGRGYAVG